MKRKGTLITRQRHKRFVEVINLLIAQRAEPCEMLAYYQNHGIVLRLSCEKEGVEHGVEAKLDARHLRNVHNSRDLLWEVVTNHFVAMRQWLETGPVASRSFKPLTDIGVPQSWDAPTNPGLTDAQIAEMPR